MNKDFGLEQAAKLRDEVKKLEEIEMGVTGYE